MKLPDQEKTKTMENKSLKRTMMNIRNCLSLKGSLWRKETKSLTSSMLFRGSFRQNKSRPRMQNLLLKVRIHCFQLSLLSAFRKKP